MTIIQNQEDIQNLRYSCRITASCLYHLSKIIKPGMSSKDLDDFTLKFFESYGATSAYRTYRMSEFEKPFGFALCTSIDNEIAHGFSNRDKVIPANSVVNLDIGCVYNKMYSDSGITVIVGEVSDDAKKLVEKTKEALWTGIKQVRAGARLGTIGYVINQVAKANKLGNITSLGGHGIGYKPHSEPYVANEGIPNKGERLFENQSICIEPLFSLGSGAANFLEDGWQVVTKDHTISAQWEHQLLITKKGCEVLTDIKEEDILPIK